jgi:3-methyladenine DNA glycosylase/8-oxoguanine DNA glycosylase
MLRHNLEIPLPKGYNFPLTAQAYALPWIWNGHTLIISLSSDTIATIRQKNNKLSITLNNECNQNLLNKLYFFLGLNENLTEFYDLCKNDPLLSHCAKGLYGMHMRAFDFWDAVIIGILQQNASFRWGWTMVKRIFENFGKKYNAPTPKEIIKQKDLLDQAKVGYRASAIIESAKAFLDGHFNNIETLSDDEAIQRLTQIKGIGEYTAKVALLFSQRRYTLFPLDRWFLKLLPCAYNKNQDEAIEFVKKKWHKFIGLFAFFVTIVTDALPIKEALQRVKQRKLYPEFNTSLLTPMTLFKHI